MLHELYEEMKKFKDQPKIHPHASYQKSLNEFYNEFGRHNKEKHKNRIAFWHGHLDSINSSLDEEKLNGLKEKLAIKKDEEAEKDDDIVIVEDSPKPSKSTESVKEVKMNLHLIKPSIC